MCKNLIWQKNEYSKHLRRCYQCALVPQPSNRISSLVRRLFLQIQSISNWRRDGMWRGDKERKREREKFHYEASHGSQLADRVNNDGNKLQYHKTPVWTFVHPNYFLLKGRVLFQSHLVSELWWSRRKSWDYSSCSHHPESARLDCILVLMSCFLLFCFLSQQLRFQKGWQSRADSSVRVFLLRDQTPEGIIFRFLGRGCRISVRCSCFEEEPFKRSFFSCDNTVWLYKIWGTIRRFIESLRRMKGKLGKENWQKIPNICLFFQRDADFKAKNFWECLLMRTAAVLSEREFYEFYWIRNVWDDKAKKISLCLFQDKFQMSNLDIVDRRVKITLTCQITPGAQHWVKSCAPSLLPFQPAI